MKTTYKTALKNNNYTLLNNINKEQTSYEDINW